MDLETFCESMDRDLIKLDKEYRRHVSDEDRIQKRIITKLYAIRDDYKAHQSKVDTDIKMLTAEIQLLKAALKGAGIALPVPPVPPIILIPSTPQNTQEAEAYGPVPLRAPSQESIPIANDADKMDVDEKEAEAGSEQTEAEAGSAQKEAEAGSEQKAGEAVGEEVEKEAEAGTETEAEPQQEARQAVGKEAEAASEEVGKEPEAGVDQEPVAPPASRLRIEPLAAPPSQPTHRRSPRLQTPVPSSPKEKRTRSDDDGSESSKGKRRKV